MPKNVNKTVFLLPIIDKLMSVPLILKKAICHELPRIIVLVGLPGSGKSTIAEKLKSKNMVIHSSDVLRQELYGDAKHQEHNTELFVELHRRIKRDLECGKNVIYDATNISKKRRISFLQGLSNIPCKKICLCVMTPYELCLERNRFRERRVPELVIKKMYMSWCPPAIQEGFDDIHYIYNYGDNSEAIKHRYKFTTLFQGDCGIDNFEQENSHHRLTLGKHCREAYKYTTEHFSANSLLHVAALLHDIGKVFTKTKLNAKGDEDGECHYYQHQCVGAYESLFYTNELGLNKSEKTYIANLIYFHMHPYRAWKQSKNAMMRHKKQMGEEMFEDVIRLHEADRAAH